MNNPISRRSFLKRVISYFLALIGLSSGGYIYSRYIEPHRLDMNYIPIYHEKIPKSFHGCKIVQFSDTHIGFQYSLEQLKKHIIAINKIKPDIIFFTGDLMDKPNQYPFKEALCNILKELNAPYGKYAIFGNHDHGGYGTDIYMQIMEKANFYVLRNEAISLELNNGEKIFVAGIDDAMLGKPDIPGTLKRIPVHYFSILLSHAPDLADAASAIGIDIQLSGHSHGGQVKIPFYGPLVTPPYGRKYIEGEYHVNIRNPLYLYVNRGLGTTRLPFRFLSVPEITIFQLQSGKT
ncbi:metallophosphoesterase [Heyndrickxia shackletonii]|uniref:Metallophosphoesterase n=1 Tax=Heyndrickxia shackletonii TaxID=157838 RepID=A0A0Q3WZT3_9BACI|nr:metallophosphoesterase [Heyndrickxia shackletonii]KQL55525.1 metallophosphoesterase [Heyndrickxia shackletonii]NEY99533.1 metallophosphoesterase [Heyndrickxia shackletonii]